MKQVLKALSLLIESNDSTLDCVDRFHVVSDLTKTVDDLSAIEREAYNKMAQAYFDSVEKQANPDNIVAQAAYNAEHLIDFLQSSDGPVFGAQEEIEYIKDNVSEDGYIDGPHVKDIFLRLYGPYTAQQEIRLMECNVVTAI